jgi:cellulose synthase/poly-beta-1,6-N-acetylglucosamine synthase-like glycosyltransferase
VYARSPPGSSGATDRRWPVSTVTEDTEVSRRRQRAGWALAYDPRAVFPIQAPVRLRALYCQRPRSDPFRPVQPANSSITS